ncbi:MAG: hypothetical protein UR53_C0001G0018 [Candidatus Magasanikbacteria bacterium GW2011_GWC2_34_16]|uniref:Uncharacterized protein n=2 Tax=Candidatus Magasanikiibacteriota TaxID=1752731 RepID=A0A0G0HQY9_9BACT|nr:MAG: hypothetical protein UR53_C0001G0018 [Candidatus Magasanikbacteria bacterium GW2011_GWC2_34_16]KKQ41035.1 MAG: hypothetical protein US58_C0006G0014 [Candidatus Magasanikbacteria bacterium GW2011_GWA2_37_8]
MFWRAKSNLGREEGFHEEEHLPRGSGSRPDGSGNTLAAGPDRRHYVPVRVRRRRSRVGYVHRGLQRHNGKHPAGAHEDDARYHRDLRPRRQLRGNVDAGQQLGDHHHEPSRSRGAYEDGLHPRPDGRGGGRGYPHHLDGRRGHLPGCSHRGGGRTLARSDRRFDDRCPGHVLRRLGHHRGLTIFRRERGSALKDRGRSAV